MSSATESTVTVIFQFTPLREGRRSTSAPSRYGTGYFNSRPYVRGDLGCAGDVVNHQLFQFTPLREGRQPPAPHLQAHYTFQFTPLREGRPAYFRQMATACYFNSRPYVRGDSGPSFASSASFVFQFTPLREGRPNPNTGTIKDGGLFQFTPLREGRPATNKEPAFDYLISIHAPT